MFKLCAALQAYGACMLWHQMRMNRSERSSPLGSAPAARRSVHSCAPGLPPAPELLGNSWSWPGPGSSLAAILQGISCAETSGRPSLAWLPLCAEGVLRPDHRADLT